MLRAVANLTPANRRTLDAQYSKTISTMVKTKFGIATTEGMAGEVDELVDV